MKRFLVIILFIFFTFLFALGDEVLLTPANLKDKTYMELYLMRNEIFAKHGHPFKNYELHNYFMGKSYKPSQDYSDSSLTEIDKQNIKLIQLKEKELLKLNYQKKEGRKQINYGNIINKYQFPEFSDLEKKMLCKNGFLVTPAKYRQLYFIYEEDDYYGIANFITADSVLQLYHLFFDFALRNIEEKFLYGILTNLTEELLNQSILLYETTDNPKLKEASLRNIAYFSVPYKILYPTHSIYGEVKETVILEITKCEEHNTRTKIMFSTLELDYTQFRPRGHYTRTEKLKRFFKAMMWYGLYYYVTGDEINDLQILIITKFLYETKSGDKKLIELWNRIYEPTKFFVGISDDLGPNEIKVISDKVYGIKPVFTDFTQPEKIIEFEEKCKEVWEEKCKIRPQLIYTGLGEPQFRFMGQRYIPDSEILQKLCVYPQRPFPKGLDVMAVLGSDVAKEILMKQYPIEWPDFKEYPERFDLLKKQFANLDKKEWNQNLYYSWLWCLKSIIKLDDRYNYPFFMNNDAYMTKNLNSSLASWAELRHDTILYGKQSGVEGGAEEKEEWIWVPDPQKGYVEPNLIFYQRLRWLLEFNKTELKKRELLGNLEEQFDRFIEVVIFLERISEKELNNRKITNKEHKQIRRFGSLLHDLTHDLSGGYSYKCEDIPVIADVHTSGGRVLEEGVGYAHEIFVVVEIEGKLKLLRGAVFSYYEFIHPAENRLTDEEWRKMLKQGKEPPLSKWINVYFSNKKVNLPRPSYIQNYKIRQAVKEKKSGWHLIRYSTGS